MSILNDITAVMAHAGWDRDGAGGWWIPFTFLWLAAIGAVVWLVIRTMRGRDGGDRGGTDRARDILAERYARGEITGEEYRERRDELG
jgi:putative membrane protein